MASMQGVGHDDVAQLAAYKLNNSVHSTTFLKIRYNRSTAPRCPFLGCNNRGFHHHAALSWLWHSQPFKSASHPKSWNVPLNPPTEINITVSSSASKVSRSLRLRLQNLHSGGSTRKKGKLRSSLNEVNSTGDVMKHVHNNQL